MSAGAKLSERSVGAWRTSGLPNRSATLGHWRLMSPQEKAFRQYLAELVRFLAREEREAADIADRTYTRLRRHALRAGDSDSYLFRIARAIAYDGRHRRTSR